MKQINMPSLGELMLQLSRQLTTRAEFRFPLSEEQAYNLLYASYRSLVEYNINARSRHRHFVENDDTVRVIKEVASYLTKDGLLTGLMFCGTCGTGKTTMHKAIQMATNWLTDNNLFPQDANLQNLNALRIVDSKTLVRKCMEDANAYCDAVPLGIEDLGREPAQTMVYGNVCYPIIDLIEARYDKRYFTIITTNLNGRQIRERYGDRVADRINEMLYIIPFGNDDKMKNESFR